MISCVYCWVRNDSDEPYCIRCGAPLPEGPRVVEHVGNDEVLASEPMPSYSGGGRHSRTIQDIRENYARELEDLQVQYQRDLMDLQEQFHRDLMEEA